LTGIFVFQRLNPFKPLIWILDRLTIPVAIGGFLSVLETFLTPKLSENTPVPTLVWYSKTKAKSCPDTPHRCMRLLAISSCFLCSRKIYNSRYKDQGGFLLGLFFAGLFSIRFLVEYVKESQGGFEEVLPCFLHRTVVEHAIYRLWTHHFGLVVP
jgi:hypothetical protein